MHFQSHQNDTLRCIVFGICEDGGSKAPLSVREYIIYQLGKCLEVAGHYLHELRKQMKNLKIFI